MNITTKVRLVGTMQKATATLQWIDTKGKVWTRNVSGTGSTKEAAVHDLSTQVAPAIRDTILLKLKEAEEAPEGNVPAPAGTNVPVPAALHIPPPR